MKSKLAIIGVCLFVALASVLAWSSYSASVVKGRESAVTTNQSDYELELPCGPTSAEFEAPRRYVGLWLYEFEGSAFLENVRQVPLHRPEWCSAAWLDVDPEPIIGGAEFDTYDVDKGCYPIIPFEVEFIGRRKSGSGGHFGFYGSEIVVDRMITVRPLPELDCRRYK